MKIDKKIFDQAKITATSSESWKRTWEITLPTREFERLRNRYLKEYGKRLDLPGFRKGKIPVSMVERHLGEDFERILVHEIGAGLLSHLKENERIALVNDATFSLDTSGEGDEVIVVNAEIVPDFTLPEYHGLKGTLRKQKISDADISGFIEQIRQKHARLKPKEEPLVDKDVAQIRMRRVGPGGVMLIGEKERGAVVAVEREQIPDELYDALSGATKGSRFEVRLPAQQSMVLETPESAEGYDSVAVIVEATYSVQQPEDEALAGIFGLEDPEEIPIRARIILQDEAESRARKALKEELLTSLARRVDIPLPPELVKEHSEELRRSLIERARREEKELEFELSDGEVFLEKHREQLELGIRELFLVDELARRHELTASEEQLESAVSILAKENGISSKVMIRNLGERGTDSLIRKITRANVENFLENEADIDVVEYSGEVENE